MPAQRAAILRGRGVGKVVTSARRRPDRRSTRSTKPSSVIDFFAPGERVAERIRREAQLHPRVAGTLDRDRCRRHAPATAARAPAPRPSLKRTGVGSCERNSSGSVRSLPPPGWGGKVCARGARPPPSRRRTARSRRRTSPTARPDRRCCRGGTGSSRGVLLRAARAGFDLPRSHVSMKFWKWTWPESTFSSAVRTGPGSLRRPKNTCALSSPTFIQPFAPYT